MTEYTTDTSKWSISIHRVSSSTAEVWVGSLFPTLIKPKKARVQLLENGSVIKTRNINTKSWKRPFRKTTQRFCTTVEFSGLSESSEYTVRFERFVDPSEMTKPSGWMHLRSAYFKTLPSRIPTKSQVPFTIGLGSCFYNHRDGGQAAGAYQALYERGNDNVKPDVTFLTGDQVYLDIGFDSLSRRPEEIRQRIGDDYAAHWQALGGILNRGGTWMLPDDHEYWNDYPFHDSLIPQLLALKLSKVRKAWTDASKDAVKNIQRSPKVEFLKFGDDLSICLADLRSYRSKSNFLPSKPFNELVSWAESLKGPGVLVIPQPLIVKTNNTERNLLSFKSQYKRLLEALGSSGHDIVVLSGDVHFGRIASCQLGNNGATLTEIISSPMSNLTYLNGIATSKSEHKPKKFPEEQVLPDSWKQVKVNYSKKLDVSTKKGFIFSAYPKTRTREHFMTISCHRDGGKIKLNVQAWRVRERAGSKNLPKPEFSKAHTFSLS
ncbi:metallophosphoesterase family protein [Aurantivibrio plasticivorans]